MRYYLILLLCLISTANIGAQNIVPNYSFEEADSCPTNYCITSIYGSGYNLGCKQWALATKATSDYFNTCAPASTPIGVPTNDLGYQPAFEGNAYVGTISYRSFSSWREYLLTNIPPLMVDTPYDVSVCVSLANGSGVAVSGFGIFFTTYDARDSTKTSAIEVTPQVNFSSYGIISDTLHWTKLRASFIPDSAYTNLILGVFPGTSGIDTTVVGTNGQSYYYYDNVVVRKASSITSSSDLNEGPALTIYPQPVLTVLNITFREKITHLEIADVIGHVLVVKDIQSTTAAVNIQDFPPGVYILTINDTIAKRFTKQ